MVGDVASEIALRDFSESSAVAVGNLGLSLLVLAPVTVASLLQTPG